MPSPPFPGARPSPAVNAIDAIAAAKTALDGAETESKKIVDAKADAKLADVKKAANDAAEKAKNAKESLATALTEAKNAKSKATGEEVNTWETAINELTARQKKKQRNSSPD